MYMSFQNPVIGSQQEPYYDTDAFYPADYATLVLGSRYVHQPIKAHISND